MLEFRYDTQLLIEGENLDEDAIYDYIVGNFKGDSLDVIYSDGRRYNIKDVDRSYFTLTQTVKDKERDIGTLSVASTNFRVQYIKEFSAVRGYVNTHFEKKNTAGIYYFDDDGEEE